MILLKFNIIYLKSGIEIGHFDAFKEVVAKYTGKEVTHGDISPLHTYMAQEQDIPTMWVKNKHEQFYHILK